MITATPRPPLSELLAPRMRREFDGKALAKRWLRADDVIGLWMARSAWSLVVLADAFRRIHRRMPVIAFPDYFCNQSLWPLRQTGARLVFYPVCGDTLGPDWAACERMERTDLFVLVHYFGWSGDGAGARAFCDRGGQWLIEDCTHVLMPFFEVGGHGDAVLYSPHKLLPAPDGALLVVRQGLRSAAGHLTDAVAALGRSRQPTGAWRMKRTLQNALLGSLLARLKQSGQSQFLHDPPTRSMARHPAPSRVGLALIAGADLTAVGAARRANSAALIESLLPDIGATALFPAANSAVVPYRAVLRCHDRNEAARLYDACRHARLPVESWPDLPPEIPKATEARHLRQTLLFLPCHQDLQAEELVTAYRAVVRKP